ncbi:MAG TPA: hypothetical protein VGA56_20130 [Opitutaceae bacterium]
MTTPPFNHRWEKRLHDELRKLPELEAPPSLVPDVMAAIRARQEAQAAAWWKRPATTWPPAMRAALSVSALVLFAALVFGGQLLAPQIANSTEASWLSLAGTKIAGLWSAAVALVNALGLVLREVLSPLLLVVIAGACFSYVALLGIGGALWRVAANQATE